MTYTRSKLNQGGIRMQGTPIKTLETALGTVHLYLAPEACLRPTDDLYEQIAKLLVDEAREKDSTRRASVGDPPAE